jgi:hypothetical protein
MRRVLWECGVARFLSRGQLLQPGAHTGMIAPPQDTVGFRAENAYALFYLPRLPTSTALEVPFGTTGLSCRK